jgi:DNA-binding response OmpR family regulator
MHKIMVIEDERHLLDLYKNELEDEGYAVIAVSTGAEAIDKIKTENPDVIVLDIRLEDMEGLEVLEQIKNYNVDIPVILNSAYSTYKANFSSWIADDYVVKSPDLTELKLTISKYTTSGNSVQERTV